MAEAPRTEGTTKAAPDEAWVDQDEDGTFEFHYWMSLPERIERLELDTDGDYDEILLGHEAERYLREELPPVGGADTSRRDTIE